MDLSFPLTTVSPTLDARVLQVLAAATTACSTAEVHRRLGQGSNEGIRKVLARLAKQGVVLTETSAHYPVYRLNRDHVAVPHIEALTRIREEILTRIQAELARWTIKPIHAALFGSFARGEATSDSDIDLLVVRPEPPAEPDEGAWLDQLDQLDLQVRAWPGNATQIIDLDLATLGTMGNVADPLVESWLTESVHLLGQTLPSLLRAPG